jgi:flagellar biosynthesis/type III secretory pathway protein FliH
VGRVIVRAAAVPERAGAAPEAARAGAQSSILKGDSARAAQPLMHGGAQRWRPATFGSPAPAEAAEAGAAGRPAPRTIGAALEEANRVLARAQVELGRAREEAARIRQQAEARLAEAQEIVTTAAEARALLEGSRAEAAQIVAQAQEEAQQVHAQARADGFQEGHAAGREEGVFMARGKLRQELELAHEVAAQAKVDRDRLIADAEGGIVRLALDVARKVIAREVQDDPDIMRGLVTRALLKAAGEDRIRLRLHPDTIARLGEYLAEVTARFAARGVDVAPDATVGLGGVLVDTRTGSVDAGVSTQLAKIEATLLDLAGGGA